MSSGCVRSSSLVSGDDRSRQCTVARKGCEGAAHSRHETFQNDEFRTHTRHRHDAQVQSDSDNKIQYTIHILPRNNA